MLTDSEMKKIKRLEELTEERHLISFQPILWAQVIIRKACDEGRLHMRHEIELIRECNKIRGNNGGIAIYGWIPIPLAYTQVQLRNMLFLVKLILILKPYFSGGHSRSLLLLPGWPLWEPIS